MKRKRSPSPSLVCTPPQTIENMLDKSIHENDEENIDFIYKSRFFKKDHKKPKESVKKMNGDWLNELEDTTPSKETLKYTPDVKEDRSDKVLKKAFKPVSLSLNSEILAKKRNPFAIKTPEKKCKTDFGPVEVNNDQVKEPRENNDKKIIIEESPDKPFEKESRKDEKVPKTSPAAEPTKSQYFSGIKKPRGISGLMKPKKKVGGKQPSLFDMWSKKS